MGRRVSVVKLQKDYERVKQQHQTILSNYSTVRVDRNAGTSSGRSAGGSFSNAYDNSAGVDVGPHGSQQQQHHILQLQGQDVEDMIIEERAKDIQKINQDLVLVNEMFRCVLNQIDCHILNEWLQHIILSYSITSCN